MEKKQVSIILFYDNKGNIILQDRKAISKRGEEYGFFGGHTEGAETAEETLKRELSEELQIHVDSLKDFQFFKNYKIYIQSLDIELERNVFLAKIPEIDDSAIKEGSKLITDFEKAFNLKMIIGDVEILKEIYDYLKTNILKTTFLI